MSDEDVALFVSITGIEDREAVLHYLEAYGDLNTAVAAALDGHGPPQQVTDLGSRAACVSGRLIIIGKCMDRAPRVTEGRGLEESEERVYLLRY